MKSEFKKACTKKNWKNMYENGEKLIGEIMCDIKENCKKIIEIMKKQKDNRIEECVHGLLRCQSSTCKIIYNRDKNAVTNMLNIVNYYVKHGSRPKKFTRKNNYSS